MNTNVIPTTTCEAYEILDEMLSFDEKQEAIAKSGEDFADEEHFGLGAWILVHWFDAAETPEQQDQVARLLSERKNYFLYAPDTLSCQFLEHYHDHLVRAVA